MKKMPEEAGEGNIVNTSKDSCPPLYLFLQDGRPVTDLSGVPLVNIAGNCIITVNKSTNPPRYEDVKGQPLTDSIGRSPEDVDYQPLISPSFKPPRRVCPTEVFALDGHPLTDSQGVPLANINGKILLVFNPKGHPVTDIDGRDVTDKYGRILNANEKPYLSKGNIPLRIFDNLGRPLTDENGYPLSNILNECLIINDEFRNPIGTIDGYPVKDADGKVRWEDGYDLSKTPKYNKINKVILSKNCEAGIAFDLRGHPLTDMNGFPLFDLDGVVLVKKRNKIWLDSNKNPVTIIRKSVYDKDEMSVLKNSQGVPVRLYDGRGFPLTDHNGVPLRNALGFVLLQFNEYGEPITDFYDEPFYDFKGNEIGSSEFSPCRHYDINAILSKALKTKSYGVQFFDRTGMPVTNGEGVPLLNARQQLMADFDVNGIPLRDFSGYEVYDISGLPIVRSLDKPLLGPNGAPIRLYSKTGRPLVDRYGFTLKSIKGEHMLKLNSLRQILSDNKDDPIFDMDGNPITYIDRFFATRYPPNEDNAKALINLDSSPLLLFDKNGEPLTDSYGRVLYDSFGLPMVTCSVTGVISDTQGNEVFNLEGFNSLQVAGRTLKDRMALYDEYDRPLIGKSGYVLRTRLGKELVQFDIDGYPIATLFGRKIYDSRGNLIYTLSADVSQIPKFEETIIFDGKINLFDCNDLPLLDIDGGLLTTSRGVPLIQLDSKNMPRSDFLGRPVYDRRGIPVANPGGVWKDMMGTPYRLYDENCMPLTDPRGKELLDIDQKPLVVQDLYGRPRFDRKGKMVRDANGRIFTDSKFQGSTCPPQGKSVALYEGFEKPLRLFDVQGRPLTDECGKPLETSKGKPILNTSRGLRNITDLSGRTVYDLWKRPLSCKEDSPIMSIDGKPLILYNKEGNPLTTVEGMPVRTLNGRTLLEFDGYGRPMGPGKTALYDKQGVSMEEPSCCLASSSVQQSITFMSLEGRPVRIFDDAGLPVTDDKGNILFSSNDTPLKAGSWGDTPTQESVSVS